MQNVRDSLRVNLNQKLDSLSSLLQRQHLGSGHLLWGSELRDHRAEEGVRVGWSSRWVNCWNPDWFTNKSLGSHLTIILHFRWHRWTDGIVHWSEYPHHTWALWLSVRGKISWSQITILFFSWCSCIITLQSFARGLISSDIWIPWGERSQMMCWLRTLCVRTVR